MRSKSILKIILLFSVLSFMISTNAPYLCAIEKYNRADATINITSPNGGEILKYGTTHTITWKGSKKFDTVDIEYYNGTKWVVIKNGASDTGSYSWTVPNNVNTTSAKVWMKGWSSTGNATDTSNATFAITNGALSLISIVKPNGGEVWATNTTENITWATSKKYDKVDIEYYNGTKWVVVVSNAPDTGSYAWKVPNVNTTNAKIWMKGWAASGNATDTSDATFTIDNTPSIKISSPNGGEELAGKSVHKITWVSSIKFDKVDIEYYNGSKWIVIKNGAPDTGSYNWTVPNISTTNAQLWMKAYSTQGNDTDNSDGSFTIIESIGTLTVTSPNGGEKWTRGTKQNITWSSTGTIPDVKIAYSSNGGTNYNTLASSTPNDGSFSWQIPTTLKSTQCKVRIYAKDHLDVFDTSDNLFEVGNPPTISLSRSVINFAYVIQGANPCDQSFFINNLGTGNLEWTAAVDAQTTWLSVTPTGGTGPWFITVKVNPAGLAVGTYTGKITITATGASNSPYDLPVHLKVINAADDQVPFGDLASPTEGSTVSGSLPITGWALDDVCLQGVTINRVVNGQTIYIGDALFVEGTRPDVAAAFPNYPNATRAGWGYVLLTNFLPEGALTLKIIAKDTAGKETVLGTRNVTVDNTHAVKPFGAIDAPANGGEASGSAYRNIGWALTPMPNTIPTNGSTISVYIDGTLAGNAHYNVYRQDIANLFPGRNNSNGAMGYLDFDTTQYENGLHTIAWLVQDNAGNVEGIGSRFFYITNQAAGSSANLSQTAEEQEEIQDIESLRPGRPCRDLDMLVMDTDPLDGSITTQTMTLDTVELDRVEVSLSNPENTACSYSGYLVVDGHLQPLPFGSRLNTQDGVFTWQLGAGFFGDYELLFVIEDEQGNTTKKTVVVHVNPKF